VYLLVLQQELPQLVEEVPVSKLYRGYFEHGGASLHFSLEVRDLINDRFGYRMCQPQQFVRQVFRLRFTGLLFWGMDESSDLRHEGWNARCIALSHCRNADQIRTSQRRLKIITRPVVHRRAAGCVAAGSGIFGNLL
jgi:hypothetical protein